MFVALNPRLAATQPRRTDHVRGTRGGRPWRVAGLRTFWVFRRRGEADLLCALPAEGPLPDFIEGGADWEFVTRCDRSQLARLGVDLEAADLGLRLVGYHVFMNLNLDWTGMAAHGKDEYASL
ncbi:hypothetical protein [Alsobacter soli]|nr:hypothetical protein [Alsobacter soli]